MVNHRSTKFLMDSKCMFSPICRLVDKINVSIGQDPNSKSLIGVLDIYGFESFKANRYGIMSVNMDGY